MNGSRKNNVSALLYVAALFNLVRVFLLYFFDVRRSYEISFQINIPSGVSLLAVAVELCLCALLLVYAVKDSNYKIFSAIIGCVALSELLQTVKQINLIIRLAQIPDILGMLRMLLNVTVFVFGVVAVIKIQKTPQSTSASVLFAGLLLVGVLWNDLVAGSISSLILFRSLGQIYWVVSSLVCSVASIFVGVSVLLIGMNLSQSNT